MAMMEENSTIRCPRCGASIARDCPPDGQALRGSPLRTCPECGRLYYDDAYTEPALEAYEKAEIRFPHIKILYAIAPTAGALVYLHSYLNNPTIGMRVPLIAFGILAIFFDVMLIMELGKTVRKSAAKKEQMALLEGRSGAPDEELRKSLERLSSKDYLDALVKCNEYVPAYFYKRIGEKPPKMHRKK